MPDMYAGAAAVPQRFCSDATVVLQARHLLDSQSIGTNSHSYHFIFAGKRKLVMRHYLTVLDVLKLYPTRKKSWAYKQLQTIRDASGRRDVLVQEFAEHMRLPEPDLRALLST